MTVAKTGKQARSAPSSRTPIEQTPPLVAQLLVERMRSVPGATELLVIFRPEGVMAYLAIAAEAEPFLDAEEVAMEELVAVRRQLPETAVDLLVVPAHDAASIAVPPGAYSYSFSQ